MSLIKTKLIYFILIAISALGLWGAAYFPNIGTRGVGFFPRLIFSGIILLCIVLILRKDDNEEEEGDGLYRLRYIATATAMIIASVLAMQYLQFAVGAFGFLLLYLKSIGKRAWTSSIAIAAVGALCLLIPVYLLNVPM